MSRCAKRPTFKMWYQPCHGEWHALCCAVVLCDKDTVMSTERAFSLSQVWCWCSGEFRLTSPHPTPTHTQSLHFCNFMSNSAKQRCHNKTPFVPIIQGQNTCSISHPGKMNWTAEDCHLLFMAKCLTVVMIKTCTAGSLLKLLKTKWHAVSYLRMEVAVNSQYSPLHIYCNTVVEIHMQKV